MTDENFIYRAVDGRSSADDPVLASIHRLRYQVYVNEWGFEKPEDHPEGLERDEFDRQSLHFYARSRSSDEVIGSARIILGSELPFPIERHFDISQFPADLRRGTSAEISRLAISKDYRRRAIDRVIFNSGGSQAGELEENLAASQIVVQEERRKCEHELIRGLYLRIYRESLVLGLTHWYAVMARGLYVILRRWGIDFRQIGPELNYHGVRAPYVVDITTLAQSVAKTNPELANLAKQCVRREE
jgi:N-acyl amino acid synthase of PEP-CTERM/exosortase system